MSCSSTLTIYRKYNIEILDDNRLNEIKNRYIKSNDGKEKYAFPIIIDSNFRPHSISEEPKTVAEIRNRYFTLDGNPVDELISEYFISNYHELWDEFNLQGYNFGRSEYQISISEAKEISVAIKYLLNGEYSEKIEDVLNNKWIKIFGDEYPKYFNFYSTKNKKIYIEKENDDCWSINFGDDIIEREYQETNTEKELNMRSTLQILETFINLCNEYHEKYIDYMLIYSVSC